MADKTRTNHIQGRISDIIVRNGAGENVCCNFSVIPNGRNEAVTVEAEGYKDMLFRYRLGDAVFVSERRITRKSSGKILPVVLAESIIIKM